jgi:hypothetical protein
VLAHIRDAQVARDEAALRDPKMTLREKKRLDADLHRRAGAASRPDVDPDLDSERLRRAVTNMRLATASPAPPAASPPRHPSPRASPPRHHAAEATAQAREEVGAGDDRPAGGFFSALVERLDREDWARTARRKQRVAER